MSPSRRPRLTAAAVLAAALAACLAAPASALAATDTGAEAPAPAGTTAPGVLPVLAPRSADSLVDTYGVNVHISGPSTPYGDTAAVIGSLNALGARHVRTTLYGNITAEWESLRQMYAAGIRSDLIMGDPTQSTDPAGLVGIIKSQFPAGLVDSVEGANEWNLSGDPNWANDDRAYQAKIWRAVKGDPATAALPVLAPSMGLRSGFTQLGDLSAYSDMGNLHLYSAGLSPSIAYDEQVANAHLVVPGKPVVFTETGYHNAMNTTMGHLPTPEGVAGVYAPRLLLEHYARGSAKVYNYELLDERDDRTLTDPEANFGLVHHDWSPKPAYTALQGLLGAVSDPGPDFPLTPLDYQVSGATPDTRQVLLQKRDGSYDLVLWRDVSVYDRTTKTVTPVAPVSVTVGLGVRSIVSVDDPSDAAPAVTTPKGVDQVAVPLAGDVQIVHITPAPASALGRPGAANTLTAVPSDGGAAMSWTSPAGGGAISGYTVTASPADGGDPVSVRVPASTRSVVVPGLVNGRSYAMAVTSFGPAGVGYPVRLASPVAPNAPAGAVGAVHGLPRDQAAQVTWSAPTSGGPVSSYTITANRGGATLTVPADSTSVLFPGLANGAPYGFSVTANGPGGSGAASAFSPAVWPVAVPGGVSGLVATAASKSAHLAWAAAPGGSSVLYYAVTTEPATYMRTVSRTATSFAVTGLHSGQSYRVTVTPIGVAGAGRTSTSGSITAG